MADAQEELQSAKTSHRLLPERVRKTEIVAMFVGVVLVVFGLNMNQDIEAVTGGNPTLSPSVVVTDEVTEPDEKKPDISVDEYEVENHLPRRIIIDNLDVDGFIQQVGLTPENAIAAPSNVHMGGWYTKSKLPGEKGLSIIDGHVSGRYSDGIFKHLDKATPGNRFAVEFGDRSRKHFEVVEVLNIPEEQSAKLLLTHNPDISSQLNLITCGGNFDKVAQEYSDRIIVISKLIRNDISE